MHLYHENKLWLTWVVCNISGSLLLYSLNHLYTASKSFLKKWYEDDTNITVKFVIPSCNWNRKYAFIFM